MPSPSFQPATLSGAALSRCRRYRYALWRTWDPELPRVVFVALNPSTADAQLDDPTLRRCMGFARAWGYGGVITANLFAWRATDPKELLRADDPVGPRNDRWLRRLTRGAPLVIAAWGNHGDLLGRADIVRRRIAPLHCLQVTARGLPAHPLYQPATRIPKLYEPC